MTKDDQTRKRSQRVHLSCVPCRQGKLKCNKDYPSCDQCYKRAREASCTYTERGLRYNAAKHGAESMRDKLDRLETFVNRLKEGTSHAPSKSIPNGDDLELEANQDVAPLVGDLHLSNTGSTRYIGAWHWESIIDDIADVKAFFDAPDLLEHPAFLEPQWLTSSTVTPVDVHFGLTAFYSKQDLLAHLPPKVELDRLVATWFNVPDSTRLLVHAPTFQEKYSLFWHDPNAVSPGWLALLFSVAGVALEVSGQSQQDRATLIQAEDFRRLAAHAFVLADYARPQPYIIEGLLLLVKSLLLKFHDTNSQSWLMISLVSSLCIQAGYHRDPATTSAVSQLDCEMRRRVWAFVCEYEIGMSYQLGVVSVINQQRADTLPPANLFDTDFRTEYVPPSRSMEDYTPMTYTLSYQKVMRIVGDIIYNAHIPTEASEVAVTRLRERLEQARDELPSQLRMTALGESIMDAPHRILDRYRLELLHQKGLCILYRGYLYCKSGRDEEQQRCLDAAETMVRHEISLLEASQPGGQLATCWVFTRRHIHDFNLASMLLCWYLKKASQAISGSDESSSAVRRRQMLRRACALWEQSGVPAFKPRQALKAIHRFVLQQQAASPEASSGSSCDGAIPSMTSSSTAIDHDSAHLRGDGGVVCGIMPTTSFASDGQSLSFPLTETTVPRAQPNTFDLQQDPLFLDIFGPNYSLQDDIQFDWP